MIKDFQPRLYQQTILGTTSNKNTLVVLPTGLGKTAVAFLSAAQRLIKYPQSKILLLAPTKPLCEQHITTFQKHLNINSEKIVLFTGSVTPKKREEMWKDAQVIISTPQGLENDLINKRINLKEVSLLIFDEGHHATGEYAYVWIAQQYEKTAPDQRILALTASPGSDMEKIKEVCQNLYIEKVEVRTEKDPDVKPYVQKTNVNWVSVNFPEEYKATHSLLTNCRKSKLIEAQKHGYCDSLNVTKTQLLKMQGELMKRISSGEREFEILRSVSLIAETLKVDHAIELIESQGLQPLYDYLINIQEQAKTSKTKATQNLALDLNFKNATNLTAELIKKEIIHPKLIKLKELIKPNVKSIIFTQYRDSAEIITKLLTNLGISNHIFFGQAKRKGKGFTQKQQKEILDQFRNNEFQILVATSVAEEGLDIPKVDQVIFYEPVPSAIRAIQRRGRTGRLEEGSVTILLTKGTRDEAYRWSAHHKENKMYKNLDKLRTEFSNLQKPTPTLNDFIPKETNITIVADHREKNNRIVKELIDLGISVTTAQLESADYVLSGNVGVELKKVPDFVSSIIDGRLLEQMKTLKQNFPKCVLIIEGEEDIYSIRKVHANAIRGMLSSIVLNFQVPILYTKDPNDTAALMAVMAKREQNKEYNHTIHTQKPKSIKEQQEFIIASLPGIGPNNAIKLLTHFHTVENVINATKEQLLEIEGLGKKLTDQITQIIKEKYKKN